MTPSAAVPTQTLFLNLVDAAFQLSSTVMPLLLDVMLWELASQPTAAVASLETALLALISEV